MLLRLARISFWLAAAAAVLTLLAPGGHETGLTWITVAASLAALMLWRSALRATLGEPNELILPPPVRALDRLALSDAAALLMCEASAAGSFEAALHAVAQVLRSELGAREVGVHAVHGADATHARVSDLVDSQPGFLTVARRIRLDASALGCAIRDQRETAAPAAEVAVPVRAQGQVIAALALKGLDLPIDGEALLGLLALAGSTLSRLAPSAVDKANPIRTAQAQERDPPGLLVEDNRVPPMPQTICFGGCDAWGATRRQSLACCMGCRRRLGQWAFDDDLCKPLRQEEVLAMLSKPLHAPVAADAVIVGASGEPRPPVLDPEALARLAELDPTGQNHLIERVLQAFRASVARLRPQADAARAADDRPALRLVVHTLKSSSASIGASHLSQLCAQIETSIRLDSGGDLGPDLDAFDAALDSVLLAIDAILEPRP